MSRPQGVLHFEIFVCFDFLKIESVPVVKIALKRLCHIFFLVFINVSQIVIFNLYWSPLYLAMPVTFCVYFLVSLVFIHFAKHHVTE